VTTTGPDPKADAIASIEEIIGSERLQAAKDNFAAIDRNQDGKLSLAEVLDFLLEQERAKITQRFAHSDIDGDGYVDLEEFLFASIPGVEVLRSFQEFDADSDGLLTYAEIEKLSEALVLPLESKQLASLLEKADRDNDNKLSYYELYGLMSHYGFQ